MRLPKTIWIAVLFTVAGVLALLCWKSGSFQQAEALPQGHGKSQTGRHAATAASNPLDIAMGRLSENPGHAGAMETLKEPQPALVSMPRDESLVWNRSFLESGQDQPTGLSFEIGSGGAFTGWQTIRIFMLDVLSVINPVAAASLGREIISTAISADEWAVCRARIRIQRLPTHKDRRVDPQSRVACQPLGRPPRIFRCPCPHRGHPAARFVVRTCLRTPPQDKACHHAAFITLDRLTFRQSVEMMRQLASGPDLAKSRGETVDNLFARSYLLDPTRNQAELTSFAGIYPNANFFISNNLLTPNDSRTREELAAHDAAALAVINGWLTDPSCDQAKPVPTIRHRLENFVKQSANK